MDDVLRRADAIVHGPRGDDYGPPEADYAKVVAIFEGITGIRLSPAEGSLFMVAVKLARLGTNLKAGRLHEDSVVDAAGYLWCFAQIMSRRAPAAAGGATAVPGARIDAP